MPSLKHMLQPDGKLPAYAWPGGYPIVYYDRECCQLCPECANKSLLEDDTSQHPISGDIYWEGPAVPCDACRKMIDSAYGDPNAEGAQMIGCRNSR